MTVLDKIDMYLVEGEFKEGTWVAQHRNDATAYAYLISKLKNGAWSVVSIDDDRMVAAKSSTKGWYPAPVAIDVNKVPAKLKAKVEKKLNQLGVK